MASDAVAGAPVEHVVSMLQDSLLFIATIRSVDDLLSDWGVAELALG